MSLSLLKNARFIPGVFCLFLFLTQTTLSARANSVFLKETQTILTKDRGYVTNGAILIEEKPDKIIKAMTDVSLMKNWLLRGMGEESARENKLRVALNELESIPLREDACSVVFSLIISKHWVLNDRKMPIDIKYSPKDPGWLNHIQYIIPLGGIFIKGGGYDVYIIPIGEERSLVMYNFNIHLVGVAQWLFNEKLYRRNIEWYIQKIISNCVEYLN